MISCGLGRGDINKIVGQWVGTKIVQVKRTTPSNRALEMVRSVLAVTTVKQLPLLNNKACCMLSWFLSCCCFFSFGHTAGLVGLVPQPGIKPMPPAVEHQGSPGILSMYDHLLFPLPLCCCPYSQWKTLLLTQQDRGRIHVQNLDDLKNKGWLQGKIWGAEKTTDIGAGRGAEKWEKENENKRPSRISTEVVFELP